MPGSILLRPFRRLRAAIVCRLVPNWRRVLRYAWSIRLNILVIVLSALEFALPYLDGVLPIPPGRFAALAFVTSIAAAVARLIPQKKVSGERDG